MRTINYSTLRQTLSATMDQVNKDAAPILVTRQKGAPVVMISLSAYNALEENRDAAPGLTHPAWMAKSIADLREGTAMLRGLVAPS